MSEPITHQCLDCPKTIPADTMRCSKCWDKLQGFDEIIAVDIAESAKGTIERTIDPETVEETLTWKITLKGMEVGEIKTTSDMMKEIVRKHLVTVHHYNQNISVEMADED